MLVVKLEIWPGGIEARKRELQRILITNVGGTADIGHYDVVIPKSPELAKNPRGIWKRGSVRNFPRLKLGPCDLLLRALVSCIDKRNPDAAAEAERGPLNDPPLAAQEAV